MKKSRGAKRDAEGVVRLLTESSVALAGTDLKLAREQAALARRVALRFNVRLGPEFRRFTCRGCKSLLVPGVNARVRLGHGKVTVVRITCLECGHVSRRAASGDRAAPSSEDRLRPRPGGASSAPQPRGPPGRPSRR